MTISATHTPLATLLALSSLPVSLTGFFSSLPCTCSLPFCSSASCNTMPQRRQHTQPFFRFDFVMLSCRKIDWLRSFTLKENQNEGSLFLSSWWCCTAHLLKKKTKKSWLFVNAATSKMADLFAASLRFTSWIIKRKKDAFPPHKHNSQIRIQLTQRLTTSSSRSCQPTHCKTDCTELCWSQRVTSPLADNGLSASKSQVYARHWERERERKEFLEIHQWGVGVGVG